MDNEKMNVDTAKSVLKNLWEGNVPLVKTFWIYYVVVIIALNMLRSVVMVLGFLPDLWSIFMVLPVWRAADKYQGQAAYGWIAKIFVVLSAFGSAAGLYYYMGWLLR